MQLVPLAQSLQYLSEAQWILAMPRQEKQKRKEQSKSVEAVEEKSGAGKNSSFYFI
jgi:hypothetical protein